MIERFLNFDKLIGPTLIKIVYFLGLIGIALYMLVAIFGALGMMGHSVLGGLGMLVAALIGAVVGVIFWRFICEIYLLMFRISDDVRDIKALKSGS